MKFRWSFLLLLVALFYSPLAAQSPLAFASGSWFNPDRNFEGLVVQLLPGNLAVVTWYTYPPEGEQGEQGEQAWIIGTGQVDGNRIIINEMVRPVGANFGPGFDPDSVRREPWGTLELTFPDCDSATGVYSGPEGFGDGMLDLVRLTSIDDIGCQGGSEVDEDRIIEGRSGIWSDPLHDGEGWMIETLADGTYLVYWFTYDDQGHQVWLIGQAHATGKTVWIEDMLVTGGTNFGSAFNSDDVVLEEWGDFGFLFEDCLHAQMRYDSPDERFGEGSLKPKRLGFLAETDCDEPLPVKPLSSGSWQLSTEMDAATTESASTGIDDQVFTAGGYGFLDRIQSFDAGSESWQNFPDLPDKRHHMMLTSDGENIYAAGGYPGRPGTDTPQNNFWRLSPSAVEWEILSDLPRPRGAGDAVYMHGRIWLVGGTGPGLDLQSYHIESGQWELFPGDSRAVPDHMQAVVFENEIWWMGGRTEGLTSNGVLIWNPVSREWREGPALFNPRSGFAAAVVQGQIMVTGGERIDQMPAQLMPAMEVFAPGATGWAEAPEPPIRVHGTTGASAGGEFILAGGSEIPGSTGQNRATQVYMPAPDG